jgi:hypothetical protein
MKKYGIMTALSIALAVPAVGHAEQIQATLIGYQEVPAVSTVASGDFTAMISHDDQSIDYSLTFSGLQGTVQQSHIHVAQAGVNGSIVIWLCQTTTTPAPAAVQALTPFCPVPGGTVTGHTTAANVIAGSIASQQLTAGDLSEVLAAIRAGTAYANVHTTLSTGGEIRGQIRASNR